MRKLIPSSSFAFALLGSTLAYPFLPCLGAAPAQAASLVTFVSGKGTDTGTCAAPTNPCRSFQFAIDQTSPGGEVKALDPANYGLMTITKSISISGVEGAGRIFNAATNAITINAGPSDVVNLSHLTLDGVNTAQNGIVLNSGRSLTIAHCVVRNFANQGIRPTGAAIFLIADTLVSDNGFTGIAVVPKGNGSAQGILDHVLINSNSGTGLGVQATTGTVDVTAVESAANNSRFGFAAGGNNAVLRLAHSAATGNTFGVSIDGGAKVESFGNNFIHGNSVADVTGGALTPVATQ